MEQSMNTTKTTSTSSSAKLGHELSDAIEQTTTLIATTTDRDRVMELITLRQQMIRQLTELVDTNLSASSDDYVSATAGLRQANASIREAQQGLATLARTIGVISRAIDLVAMLI